MSTVVSPAAKASGKDTTVKAVRKTWTQAHVALLVREHAGAGSADAEKLPFTVDERRAKLIELGLVARDPRPVLHEDLRSQLTVYVERMGALAEPQRTLAVRYAIRSLQALLPKRGAK